VPSHGRRLGTGWCGQWASRLRRPAGVPSAECLSLGRFGGEDTCDDFQKKLGVTEGRAAHI